MGFISHLRDLIRFMQLTTSQRRLTFYSEGKNYWPHLEGMVRGVLDKSDINICYISSDEDDPGLLLKHPNYRTFKLDEGFVRNWLFENIETDVMVMTMPDLHQYQVKKSKHKVHYVYVQHALVSLHVNYRKGAFDHFDTIFCSGPHHVEEIRAMEAIYSLPPKNLVEHGNERLDDILKEVKRRPLKEKAEGEPIHILLAPSWGDEGTIESGLGATLVDQLIAQHYRVTLRPHPQTIKFAKNKIDAILIKHQGNPLFSYEDNVAGQDSLHGSDLLISDWSGVALDYALGLNKPVLFLDIPRKVNNPDYKELKTEALESFIRDKVGRVVALDEISEIPVEAVLTDKIESELILKENVFNLNNASKTGTELLMEILNKNG